MSVDSRKISAMNVSIAVFAVVSIQATTTTGLQNSLNQALSANDRQSITAQFEREGDASYLFEMAGRRGGLKNISAVVMPTPPGWKQFGTNWVTFHTYQQIEQDHDPIYECSQTTDKLRTFRIGREVPEWLPDPYRIKHMSVKSIVDPTKRTIDVDATATLNFSGTPRALVMRLNDIYRLKSAIVNGKSVPIVTKPEAIKSGALVRLGGIVVYWSTDIVKTIQLHYFGSPQTRSDDKISDRVAYITAWWTPSIGRLPFTSEVQVDAPELWHARSEGELVGSAKSIGGGVKRWNYKCDLPISYPKIIAGAYALAAELKRNGKTYRSYQLDPVQKERAERDVLRAADGMEYFESILGPTPWPGYDIYDGDTYYGIESYSHTLLQREYTTTFVTHELGHTYFGGMAPCAYTRDSWNESVTQYVDSILFRKNEDRSLEAGYRTNNINIPLTNMPVPWAHGSATYYRGAYVMNMLAQEIGEAKVIEALKRIVTERRGKETIWADLREYFEKSSGQQLGWFWAQWIESAQVPTINVKSAECSEREGKWNVRLEMGQSGASSPYRLRYMLRFTGNGKRYEYMANVRLKDEHIRLDLGFKPEKVEIVAFPYTMARAGEPAEIIER